METDIFFTGFEHRAKAMKLLSLIAGTALLASTSGANAYADGCAIVLKTPDGFLNLRKAPKMDSKIVGRLKPGQEVAIAG